MGINIDFVLIGDIYDFFNIIRESELRVLAHEEPRSGGAPREPEAPIVLGRIQTYDCVKIPGKFIYSYTCRRVILEIFVKE